MEPVSRALRAPPHYSKSPRARNARGHKKPRRIMRGIRRGKNVVKPHYLVACQGSSLSAPIQNGLANDYCHPGLGECNLPISGKTGKLVFSPASDSAVRALRQLLHAVYGQALDALDLSVVQDD